MIVILLYFWEFLPRLVRDLFVSDSPSFGIDFRLRRRCGHLKIEIKISSHIGFYATNLSEYFSFGGSTLATTRCAIILLVYFSIRIFIFSRIFAGTKFSIDFEGMGA